MERTIKVKGVGMLFLKPDKTKLKLNLQGKDKSYEKTLQKASDDIKIITNAITKIGFSKEELKTSFVTINQKKEGHYELNQYLVDFEGFEYRTTFEITFFNNNELLGKLLSVLSVLPVEAEIAINYFISDKESSKNNLLALATKDAVEKANLIALAAGVKLGTVLAINYEPSDTNFESPRVGLFSANHMLAKSESNIEMDLEPVIMKVTESVTITYEIE